MPANTLTTNGTGDPLQGTNRRSGIQPEKSINGNFADVGTQPGVLSWDKDGPRFKGETMGKQQADVQFWPRLGSQGDGEEKR